MPSELIHKTFLLTTSNVTLFTPPPGEYYQIVTLVVCNADTADRWVKFWLVQAGGTAGVGNAITSGQMPIPFNSQPMERYRGQIILPGEFWVGVGEVNSQLCVHVTYIRVPLAEVET